MLFSYLDAESWERVVLGLRDFMSKYARVVKYAIC